MPAPIALLPMYDWPEIRDATDAYWSALHDSLSDAGFSPPTQLTRTEDPLPFWQHPNLLLGQTCGLPYVEKLAVDVSLVGTPAYDIDCGAGCYFSVIVVHKDSGIEELTDLDSAIFGYNDPLSQSGVAAFFSHLASEGISLNKIRQYKQVMSHRNAITELAERHIDLASIDAITWEHAKRFVSATDKLTVIARTDPTPGLPLITAQRPEKEVDRIHHAVVEAIASLSSDLQDTLLLSGLAATEETDYQLIKRRYENIRFDLKNLL
ncbi:phosphate/phosphite/phosphonate ABC transporter substrate-binding protein [Sneathiella litorea]|uniref:PhnD/SsuA/transferrin family substrate-binding protein n=1 Tax=Sneathiella litorea TaxID=2606216 RepID=A0A6L8W340_9PROT|nr:PhnD/SsuA/transferrin family substrate-binding protein [Sneathiella litorea]MZR29401.1 PhnD/SsuA/transferrin family substrate-binding protein [Sneathiella litorea]